MAANIVHKRVRFDLPPLGDDEPNQHNIPIDPLLLAISPPRPAEIGRPSQQKLFLRGPRLPDPTAQAVLVPQYGTGGFSGQTSVYGDGEFQAEPRTFKKEGFSDEEFNPKRRRYKKEDRSDEEYKPASTRATKYLEQEGQSDEEHFEPIKNHHLRELKYSELASINDQPALNAMTEPRARAARHKGQLNFQSESEFLPPLLSLTSAHHPTTTI